MKIALVDPSLFTWPYDQSLVRGLQAAGHEVTLYGTALSRAEAAEKPGFLEPHFYGGLNAGIWRKIPRPLFRALKGFSHLLGMGRLVAEMARRRPDVIHIQWLPLPMIDGRFLRRLRAIAPLVLTVHDTTPFNGAPGSRLQSLGAANIDRHFDALITHTETGRHLVAQRLGEADRVHQVAHGLLHDTALQDPVGTSEGVLAPVPGTERPVTFLLFGKLKPYKGLDILIRALALMSPATRARCRLRVVGKSYMDVAPLETLARQLSVADRIEFDLRFVAAGEIDGIFRGADVVVLPYREIEASGVLMTAIAVGKPVIASRIGSAAELFATGNGGILIPRDDAQALAEAMGRFAQSPSLTAAYGRDIRRLRDSIPSWAEIAQATTRVYDDARRRWRGEALGMRKAGSGRDESDKVRVALGKRAPKPKASRLQPADDLEPLS